MKKTNITIHGSTGSIGRNALSVIMEANRDYNVFALTAKNNIRVLKSQIIKHNPTFAVVQDEFYASKLKKILIGKKHKTKILYGASGYSAVSKNKSVHCVLSAITGGAALRPTYDAILSGKKVLLANKESLVMSGDLMLDAAKKSGSIIIPVDSEHNALFQILSNPSTASINDLQKSDNIKKITLTASGGPFLGFSKSKLKNVSPKQAIKHPTWKMGQKISIDSATMMNKGLEVIEASLLYNIDIKKIDILIHPQSIVHALVTFFDQSTITHMSDHDMKIPIRYALSWPDRYQSKNGKDLSSLINNLNFRRVKLREFPCLDLCLKALKIGLNAPTILNAANEVAVDNFLNKKIRFTDIPLIISNTLKTIPHVRLKNIDDVIECDLITRKYSQEYIEKKWK